MYEFTICMCEQLVPGVISFLYLLPLHSDLMSTKLIKLSTVESLGIGQPLT